MSRSSFESETSDRAPWPSLEHDVTRGDHDRHTRFAGADLEADVEPPEPEDDGASESSDDCERN